MKVYYVGLHSHEPYEQEILEGGKYFLKKESALKYLEELENDEDGWIKNGNSLGIETFFDEIDVIED